MSFPEKLFFILLFVLVIAGVALFGLKNYDLIMGPDHYRYVTEAMSLARGRLGEDLWLARVFPDSPYGGGERGVLFGNAWIKGGKIYVIHPLGWPLLLAGAYLLGGKPALFLANPFLVCLLLTGQFFFIREVLSGEKDRAWLALLAVLLLIWLPRYRLLFSSLHPSRDIPALTFFLWGMYFLVRSFRRKEKVASGFLFLASGLSAFACLIRQTTLWLLVPAAGYLWLRLGKRKALLVPIAGIFLLFSAVLLLENYFTFGLWLPQLIYLFADESPWEVHAMVSAGYFLPHLQRYLSWLYHFFPLTDLLMALLGAVTLRRKGKELWFLLIAPPLTTICFFSLFKYAFPRYVYSVFPSITALAACGGWAVVRFPFYLKIRSRFSRYGSALLGLAIVIAEVMKFNRGLQDGYVDLVLLILGFNFILSGLKLSPRAARIFSTPAPLAVLVAAFIFVYFSLILKPPEEWRGRNAFRLASELEECITAPEALVLAERNLTYSLDFHTRFYSIRPAKLVSFSGWELPEAIKRVMKQMPVYILDNKGKKNAGRHVARLKETFSLVPVKRFNTPALNLIREDFVENELLTLYRIGQPAGKDDDG